MHYFLIHGLARFFAASAMERRERRLSSYRPAPIDPSKVQKKVSTADLAKWDEQMRWLIPYVQATGSQIIIENPKSHEQMVIDQNTKELPLLTLEWMQKYDKQELLEWMADEKAKQRYAEVEKHRKLELQRIEETLGRERFGNSFTLNGIDVQKKPNAMQRLKQQLQGKDNILTPIAICVFVSVLTLVGYWFYRSSAFDGKRYERDIRRYYTMMQDAVNSPIKELMTHEGFRFDMDEKEFKSLNEKRKSHVVDELYGTKYDWQFGNVPYIGDLIYGAYFHEGKLCCYDITIYGRIINGNYTTLTDSDVKYICDIYKSFLRKDYTFKELPDLNFWSKDQTYVFTKNNMAITLRRWNDYRNNLTITCENRPISALIKGEVGNVAERR